MTALRLIAALAVLLTALGAGIEDYLAEMKTTMRGVEAFVQDNIATGNFYFPPACARIPLAKRAAVVRAAGGFARTFTASAAFKAWYETYREGHKPAAPELTPSIAESRAEQIAQVKKQIAETQKNAAEAPASQKGIFNDVLAALKSSLKQIEGMDKSQDAAMEKMIVEMNAAAKKTHEEKLAAFERENPVGDPRPLVRRRLEEFLEKTKNVDFGAQLKQIGKQMVFANPDYENKSSEWKLAFRAGKAATEAARSFAGDWLKSL
jgi:flagellar biosynthesis GTPase FlhF